jgi:hypothetical protein
MKISQIWDPGSGPYFRELSNNFLGVKNSYILCQFSVSVPGGINPDLENTIFKFLEKLCFVQNYLEKVTAIYDYNADKEDELTFQV